MTVKINSEDGKKEYQCRGAPEETQALNVHLDSRQEYLIEDKKSAGIMAFHSIFVCEDSRSTRFRVTVMFMSCCQLRSRPQRRLS